MDPLSLKQYARCRECSNDDFIFPNDRPSLGLFNDHANSVIEKSGLDKLYMKGFVADILFERDQAIITTKSDTVRARHVILAIGRSGALKRPAWAQRAAADGGAICHVLDGSFCREQIPERGEIVVVGGGMSAVQTALSIADKDRHVTLLSPHSIIPNNYDSDPGWMGPKYLNRYRKISCFRKRRRIINKARNSGTITHDLKRELIKTQNRNECNVTIDQVENCSMLSNDLMLLNLKSGDMIAANHIVLATGFDNKRPGGSLLDGLISNYRLNCSECGYPITDSSLRWQERFFVSGALAELEVGPASANIIGARMAAEKILRNKIKNY
jgi:lysine/ornithine N-monooxygenase